MAVSSDDAPTVEPFARGATAVSGRVHDTIAE
jgi:hypothetical protein